MLPLLLIILTVLGMEAFAWFMHRFIMHGPLWCWHESHHRPREGRFEKNDLFGIVFSLPSIVLIYIGVNHVRPCLWVGIGMAAYGLIYFVFHDVIVHRRIPVRIHPKRGYLHRITRAHVIHHRTRNKHGAVSFGFLYAPQAEELLAKLGESTSDKDLS